MKLSTDVFKFNIWVIIWETSEFLHIGLGRFAPYVFGKMMKNTKMERIDEKDND